MDYIDIFRPVISLAAHAAAETAVSGDNLTFLREDIDNLMLDARAHHRRHATAAHFDNASFAVCAWLDDIFTGGTFVNRYCKTEGGGVEFFARLDALLDAKGFEKFEPERLKVIAVYAACLDFGFTGPYGNPDGRETLQAYRSDCREDLAATAASAESLFAAERPVRAKRRRPDCPGWLKALPFWLVPIAATIALYLYYRATLADLYATVIG